MNAVRTVRPSTEIARVTDTQPPTLPASPSTIGSPPPEPAGRAAEWAGLALPARFHRWWAIPITVLATLALVAVVAAGLVPSEVVAEAPNRRLGIDQEAPFALTPASAQPANELIVFGDLGDQAERFPPEGEFRLVTVVEPSQSVLSWLVGKDEPAVRFITHEDKFGFQTPEQRTTFALESMRTSGQVAQFVALQRVGFDVELLPGDVLIERMVCLVASDDGSECIEWSPSDAVLDAGDRILDVDDVTIDGVEDLSGVLAGRSPGDIVTMTIDRPDAGELEVDVELTAAPDEPDRTIVGFYPFDTRRVRLPFEVEIDSGRIGGPSAGLAFTLSLIDELTPGELTGGVPVAVTGSIGLDGSVGRIGGLAQKASAVAQTGIDVLLVPADQSDDELAAARDAGGDELEIVPVATLDEALDVLARLGGDPLPPVGECAPAVEVC